MKRIYLAAIAVTPWVACALLLELPAAAGPISRPGLALLSPAAAQSATEYTLGSLRIKAPWMRATPKGAKVAGGFLTVTNTGDKPDRLIGVESDIATRVRRGSSLPHSYAWNSSSRSGGIGRRARFRS